MKQRRTSRDSRRAAAPGRRAAAAAAAALRLLVLTLGGSCRLPVLLGAGGPSWGGPGSCILQPPTHFTVYPHQPTHTLLSSQAHTRTPSPPTNPHLQDVVYGPGYNEDIHPPEKKKGGAKRKAADPADAAQLKEEVEQLDIQVSVGLAAAGQEADGVHR